MTHVDVLFYPPGGAWWDGWIRLVSPVHTHVAVRVDADHCIEAVFGRGVVRTRLDCLPCLETWRADVTPHQRARIFAYLVSTLGDRYSVAQAVGAGILKTLGLRRLAERIDQNWFCSELVVCAFRAGGVDLLPGYAAASVVPDDLKASLRLTKVT